MKNNKTSNMSKIIGFSLLELLSAMLIGLILLMVISKVFIEFNKTHKIENALSIMQENARFAAHIIRGAVASAGVIGPAKLTDYLPITNAGVTAINQINTNNYFVVYKGMNNIWVPVVPKTFNITPKKNTDVIAVKNIEPISSILTQDLDNSNKIHVSFFPKFNENDDIIITDCFHVVLAHVQSVFRSAITKKQILTTTRIINDKFKTGAEIGTIQTQVFYIKKTANSASLCYVNSNGRTDELVPDILDLKVSDWIKNKIIKIKLLLNPPSHVALEPKYFQFDAEVFNRE
ncbi:MAG: hypothetical protein PVI75_04680 [Gammaproteobacteria bacterium]|jgi:type IV pilus assembly protein PilW